MAPTSPQSSARAWALARSQHWVITRKQLLDLGLSAEAIRHRLASGRLRKLYRGVYAVGPQDTSELGRWMAAVLACRPGALLSHRSAGKPGTTHRGIPVTTPTATLVDLATQLGRDSLVAAVGEADRLDLANPEAVRAELDEFAGRPGVADLRRALDRQTFVLTHTELERLFKPIVAEAGLPPPSGQRRLGRHRVDFFWAGLGLVVETDGLRYHRAAARQGADLKRGNAHAVGHRRQLRFSHAQVSYERAYVRSTLAAARAPAPAAPPW